MRQMSRRALLSDTVLPGHRPLPRGLVIVGLAAAAWLVLFLAGAMVWSLIT